jgi:hypothetical protein
VDFGAFPNRTWISPNACGGHLTPAGGCQEGSDEFDIFNIFWHFQYFSTFSIFFDISNIFWPFQYFSTLSRSSSVRMGLAKRFLTSLPLFLSSGRRLVPVTEEILREEFLQGERSVNKKVSKKKYSETGLPDFPWYNIPKRRKNVPNYRKVYQITIKYVYQITLKYTKLQ